MQSLTYLVRQHISPEVAERELKLLETIVDGDFDGDEGIRRDSARAVSSRSGHVGL